MNVAARSPYRGVLVVAYLLGGISWALLIGKQFYRIDVRAVRVRQPRRHQRPAAPLVCPSESATFHGRRAKGLLRPSDSPSGSCP